MPGARVDLTGTDLPLPADRPPRVFVGGLEARVVAASAGRITFIVPADATGAVAVRLDDEPGLAVVLEVGRNLARDVHQVDSPLFDRSGRLYVTQSGSRDNRAPVPLHRVTPTGVREPLAVDIANPTSLALGPDGLVYVSSRFDGRVFRLTGDDRAELYASDLGVATGLAFAPDGTLFVGDRSGNILRVSPTLRVDTFATLPPSVAAFHLTFGPDNCLYVTAPTLATHDPVYRITPDRLVDVVCDGFGRPQGLAFDAAGRLYVADALAGAAGLYRVDVQAARPRPELVVRAPSLVGVAFNAAGDMVLATNDAIWSMSSSNFEARS